MEGLIKFAFAPRRFAWPIRFKARGVDKTITRQTLENSAGRLAMQSVCARYAQKHFLTYRTGFSESGSRKRHRSPELQEGLLHGFWRTSTARFLSAGRPPRHQQNSWHCRHCNKKVHASSERARDLNQGNATSKGSSLGDTSLESLEQLLNSKGSRPNSKIKQPGKDA